MSHFRSGAALAALFAILATPALAQVERSPSRGEYLARIMDCGGCHTPGALVGNPEPARALAGSAIGFRIPDLGYFYPPNLTPHRTAGIGSWSEADIIRAVRTGVRPDGRVLAPAMPWRSYSALSDADARALARYLKSLPPIDGAAPPPAGPDQTPPAPYLTVAAP
jgi:mono/diheme cytochrome c family protein